MPVYEYNCRGCQKTFEILTTSSKDEKPDKCPKCGDRDIVKYISVSSSKTGGGLSPAYGMPSTCGGKSGFS